MDTAGAEEAMRSWLCSQHDEPSDTKAFVKEFCERLVAAGVSVVRFDYSLPTLHPQLLGRQFVWNRARQRATETAYGHETEFSAACLDSPLLPLHEGVKSIRRRLDVVSPRLDFPILDELRTRGATDYLAVPLRFSSGQTAYVSWASDRPGGFTDDELDLLDGLRPLLALRFEVQARGNEERTLLEVYLGRSAARRVLRGQIRRGKAERIHAAVWYCDLRGFTAMSARLPPERVIAILDDYFDCMATQVQRYGGEVLKFIGDGMLAAFNIEGSSSDSACCQALDAADDALSALAELSSSGDEPLAAGIALHRGDVLFGNIGAPDRLDFTVIGPAVNEVTRIEGLCRTLDQPLLVSERFAASCPCRGFASLGRHTLRGVEETQEVFVPQPSCCSYVAHRYARKRAERQRSLDRDGERTT